MEDKAVSLIKHAIVNLDVATDYQMTSEQRRVIEEVMYYLNKIIKQN